MSLTYHSDRTPLPLSRTCPTSCNIYPFCQTRPLFSLHIHNISVASTPASYTILFDRVPGIPILVFFPSFFLVQCCLLQVGSPCHLTSWRVCRTMLDSGMTVAKVTEVMDITWGKKCSSSERMNWCVSPLFQLASVELGTQVP
jgi:hypothetical protein